jgi:hypothetical protein
MQNPFSKRNKPYWQKRPFDYIAFWQSLGFLMLICLIWLHEALDLTAIIFGTSDDEFNFMGASLLTAFAITVAFITIAHTYVQQRKTLKGFITICAYCKRVQIAQDAWSQIDEFIEGKSHIIFSHGVCPECLEHLMEQMPETPEQAE